MKSSVTIVVAAVIIVALGAWYILAPHTASAPTPAGNLGTVNSQNQGNMGTHNDSGMQDNGVLQQPGADGAEGSIIGSNLSLGTDGNATLGTYLIGYTGMTVYTYAKDSTGVSNCYGTCAINWPPYIIGPEDNALQTKSGVDKSKVGTITRADGKIQMTYNGMPLYFYSKDRPNTSDATGQGVGGVWFVVKP